MKIETKRKIIYLVKKLIRYDETMDTGPLLLKKTKDIQISKVSQIYCKKEIKLISKDQIKFALNLPLIDELMANNAIKYTQEVDPMTGDVKKTATIKFILT